MQKYIANSTDWPTALVCCWEESRDADKDQLFDYLVKTLPGPIRDRMEFGPNGARWPSNYLPSDKFTKMYAKRGPGDLKSLSGMAFTASDDLDVDFYCTTAGRHFTVYGYDEFWNLVNPRTYVENLVRAFPIFYGQMSGIPIAGYQGVSRVIEYQIHEPRKVRRQFDMLRYYNEAYHRWLLRNGAGYTSRNDMVFLTFVYTDNILSDVHFNAHVPSEGCTLREWIIQTTERGSLHQVTEANAIWHVPPELRESVVRSLWKTGLFPTSRHFEIVKWDSYNNLPWLAARKSVLEFLISPENLVMAKTG
jgi:hypothetical protein